MLNIKRPRHVESCVQEGGVRTSELLMRSITMLQTVPSYCCCCCAPPRAIDRAEALDQRPKQTGEKLTYTHAS